MQAVTIETKRESLHRFINTIEEKKVEALYTILEQEIEEESIDLEAYNKDIEEAEKEIAEGHFYTHEQALAEIETWKKK